MEELKKQIKTLGHDAALLSSEAQVAFAAEDFVKGKALMRETAQASKTCQDLIQQMQSILSSQ